MSYGLHHEFHQKYNLGASKQRHVRLNADGFSAKDLVFLGSSQIYGYCAPARHPVMTRSHGDFQLVVDRLVSCCGLLLTCSVISLIIVPLDVVIVHLHSIYMSLNDCISLIR